MSDFDEMMRSWKTVVDVEETVKTAQRMSRRAVWSARMREAIEIGVTFGIIGYVVVRAVQNFRTDTTLLALSIAALLGWSTIVRFRESRQRWNSAATERMAFLEREVFFARTTLHRSLLSIAVIVPLFVLALFFGRQNGVTLGAADALTAPFIVVLERPLGKILAAVLLGSVLAYLLRSALASRRALAHFARLTPEFRQEASLDRLAEEPPANH